MTFDPILENARQQQRFAAGLLPPDMAAQHVEQLPPPPGGGVTIRVVDGDFNTPAPGGLVLDSGGGGTRVTDTRHDTTLDTGPRRAASPEAQLGAAMEAGYDPDGYDPGARR